MSDPLAALRQRFIARCAEDLAVLASTDTGADARRRVIHRIAGAAGMFGFPELGALAGGLDDQVADGQEPDALALSALLESLRAVNA